MYVIFFFHQRLLVRRSFSGATPSNHELSFGVAVVVSHLVVADPRILW